MSVRTRGVLAPYVPSTGDPFDVRKAGHLLRRAAFGGSLEERQRLVKIGVAKSIAGLFEAGSGEDVDDVLEDVLGLGTIENVRSYRVWRMLAGKNRVRERMSLFWHDHFATSNQKVKNHRMMGRQLATFDRLGLGTFDDLLLAVSKDPAMIRWLDNETNVRGKANENYARELFELFSLGEGNYTEKDIQEAARAFTGWHLRDEEYAFKRIYWDIGEKEVFGKKGRFLGEDIVKMVVAHKASAPFLARKLLAFFVHPEPKRSEVDALAKVYLAKKRNIGDTVRVLLRSQLFFSDRAYRSMVKSPADFVVGMVRCMGGQAAPKQLALAMTKMGQAILEPPNVAGWKGGRSWITSASWLVRSNFSARVFGGSFKLKPGAAELLNQKTAEGRADAALAILLDGDVDAKTRKIIRALAAKKNQTPVDVLQAVQCLPEGQML